MKQRLYIIPLLILFTSSCSHYKSLNVKLKDLNACRIELLPTQAAYTLIIEAKGKVDCPVKLYLLMNGKNRMRSPYSFNGEIDTLIHTDWYQDLGFEVDPIECAGEVDVKVKLYYQPIE